jgi:hypothetical protein
MSAGLAIPGWACTPNVKATMRLTEIHVFQCGDNGRFAFSVDKAGSNLPRSACKEGWLLRGRLTPEDLIDAQYAAAISATSEQGFFIFEHAPHWPRR